MKHTASFVVFVISSTLTFGQSSADEYGSFSRMADSLFKAKDYKTAATTYAAEQYKKDLPAIEAKEKGRSK